MVIAVHVCNRRGAAAVIAKSITQCMQMEPTIYMYLLALCCRVTSELNLIKKFSHCNFIPNFVYTS